MELTPNEMRAIEIVYERETHRTVPFAEIPDDDRARIVKQIEGREASVEWFATHNMLDLKISEGRRFPRRHLIAAMGFLAIMCVLIAIGISIWH